MRRLIVDGYNVIHAWPRLKRALSERGLEDARRLLVHALAGYAARTGDDVTVVFDAHARVAINEPNDVIDGVSVVYGTKTASADHIIERLANEASRRGMNVDVTVVTDDRLQRSMVGAMGVPSISAAMFEADVTRAASATAHGLRAKRETATTDRIEHQLPADVARRLEALRRGRNADVSHDAD